MSLLPLGITDLGGVPLVYNTDRGLIQQDPAWVFQYAPDHPVNPYGPGDVFKSPGEGGRLVDYNEALGRALALAAPKATSIPQSVAGTQIRSATTAGGATSTGAQLGRDAGSAAETTISQLWKFLERPIWPGDPKSLSTGVVLAIGAGLLLLAQPKRRRR